MREFMRSGMGCHEGSSVLDDGRAVASTNTASHSHTQSFFIVTSNDTMSENKEN